MVWFVVIFFSLFVGIFIGTTIMYYRNRDLLKNQKNLCNELQNNKTKLNEYEKRLNNHFTDNIELLNKIAENYRSLYQNMTKNASFFLPNIYPQDNMYAFRMNDTNNQGSNPLPVEEVPLDYSDNTNILQKNYDVK